VSEASEAGEMEPFARNPHRRKAMLSMHRRRPSGRKVAQDLLEGRFSRTVSRLNGFEKDR
jgi:hypothetical protein